MRRHYAAGVRVVLIERRPRVGVGLAYSTTELAHRLNVPAGQMGAFPRDPEHFQRWARQRDPKVGADHYLPRAWYGEYLLDVLGSAERAALPGVDLERLSDEVLSVEVGDGADSVLLRLRGGGVMVADRAVLALG